MASNIITRNPSYLNRKLTIDRNTALTATGKATGLWIDYDHTGISASGQIVTGIGLDLDMNCESVIHVGTVNQTGIDLDMVAATDGVQKNVCIDVKCYGGDEATGLTIDTAGGTKSTGIYIDNKNGGQDFKNVSSADNIDYFLINTIAAGATTLRTVDTSVGATAHLNIDVDGHVEFERCAVGFAEVEAPFGDSDVIGGGGYDTDIDFRTSNKIYVLMTDDVVNMNLIFPNVSGNFLLLLKYDGDHDITNWKVNDSNASTADGDAAVKWAGGSAPATTDSGFDIFSFYWTAESEIAFGVGSLGFAS